MEEQIIQLIARDRLEIPLSSMYQKIKKIKKKDAKSAQFKLSSKAMNPEKWRKERNKRKQSSKKKRGK